APPGRDLPPLRGGQSFSLPGPLPPAFPHFVGDTASRSPAPYLPPSPTSWGTKSSALSPGAKQGEGARAGGGGGSQSERGRGRPVGPGEPVLPPCLYLSMGSEGWWVVGLGSDPGLTTHQSQPVRAADSGKPGAPDVFVLCHPIGGDVGRVAAVDLYRGQHRELVVGGDG